MRSDFSHDAETDNNNRNKNKNGSLRLSRQDRRITPQRHSHTSILSPRHTDSRNLSSSGRVRKPARGYTKDWIDQFLSGQPRTERSNWLSDDSESDSNSFLTTDHSLHEERSDDWLGLEGSISRSEDPESTPKPASRIRRVKRSDRVDKRTTASRRSKHNRSETLRQEDIWGFAYDKDPPRTSMSGATGSLPGAEKPLPPIPQETPSLLTAPNPKTENNGSTRPISPRPRKKIAWRGKACIIALPLDDKRGSEESGYRLLTAEDVKQRLKSWEDKGYDIRGFSVSSTEQQPSQDGELGGISRPTHPDPTDCQDEWNARKYAISFPDKEEWDSYVNFLQEEKLRALGVSLGDEDEEENEVDDPALSNFPAAVSQAAVPFPGLVATPPIPTGSAGTLGNPFSPVFNQSTNVGIGIGSLASPSSQLGTQTPFLGVDQSVIEGYHLPFQPTPPVQSMFNPSALPTTLPGNMPNMSSILSPISALNGGMFSGHQPKDSLDDQFDPDGYEGEDLEALQSPTSNQDQYQSGVYTPPKSYRVSSDIEIAHPTPRGHGHNLSETLQKGLDQAGGQPDYSFEGSTQRQPNTDSGLSGSRWAVPENDPNSFSRVNFQQNDQKHGENFGQEASDLDTNPSLSGTTWGQMPWYGTKQAAGSHGRGGHQSHLSTSSLNVEAKEFKPVDFSFQGDNQKSIFTFNGGHTSNNPSTSSGKQNAFDQGGFKFSSATFNVEAPVFNPRSSTNSTDAAVAEGSTTKDKGNKIFGDFDLSQASKAPSKKSKAIPIVRPDDADHANNEDDTKEDENSRTAPPADRQKRARRSNESLSGGDMKLRLPVHALTETTNVSQVTAPSNNTFQPAEGKENEAPGSSDRTPAAEEDSSPTSVPSRKRGGEEAETPASEASTWMSEQQQQSEQNLHQKDPAKPQQREQNKAPASQATEPVSGTGMDGSNDDGSGRETPDGGELDAIMDQLNGDDSDIGIEREGSPHVDASFKEESPELPQQFVSEDRSAGPSPSPKRIHTPKDPNTVTIPELGSFVNPRILAYMSPQKNLSNGIQSSVQQLIHDNDHISDWGDMVSTSEDEKLANTSKFLGRRVNDVDVDGGALEERLTSMERSLVVIQQSMATAISKSANRKNSRRFSFIDVGNEDADADADDEEEEEGGEGMPGVSQRGKSSLDRNDHKFDKLKKVVLDALAMQMPQQQQQQKETATSPALPAELDRLRESVAGLKDLTARKLAEEDSSASLRSMMQEVVAGQLDLRKSEAEEIGAESLMLQIDGLKRTLKLADERSEEEYKQRREAQESVAELRRVLQIADREATRHSEAAEAAESRLLQFKEEKIPYLEKLQFQTNSLSQERESLQLTLAELSSKNIVLQSNLDEYRVTSDNWKRESESLKQSNKDLLYGVDSIKRRFEDSMAARQDVRSKFDRLQEDMANAVRDIARDQASWRKQEEEQATRYEGLRATYEREKKLREKLEYDVNELEKQEREATKLKLTLGQSQLENTRLEDLTTSLRSQLDNVKLDADKSRQRYEMQLEEASEAKASAVAAAVEAGHSQLAEREMAHERALDGLREDHSRALHHALQDHQREEAHLVERLMLSDEKVVHYQDRVRHLEEKVEIANSAARAAASQAAAAQGAAKASSMASQQPHVETEPASPSITYRRGSLVPDKISPQALRESILVLQDQLQNREARIDELDQELSSVDKELPTKLKAKDTEITWLRELLGVRIDDLQDIIETVSRPSFDKDAVRDAAIRLRANLQMQQQEQDRALFGPSSTLGGSLPSISTSISSLAAATPRSIPLAAAAALGNWRKGTTTTGAERTPSKTGNAASAFLSGLLTPPGSSFRQQNNSSPTKNISGNNNNDNDDYDFGIGNDSGPATSEEMQQPETTTRLRGLRTYAPMPTRPLSALRTGQQQQQQQQNTAPDDGDASLSAAPLESPKTPPLLRKSSYDHDADPTSYDNGFFGEGSMIGEGEGDGEEGQGDGEREDEGENTATAMPEDGSDGHDAIVPESPKGTMTGAGQE